MYKCWCYCWLGKRWILTNSLVHNHRFIPSQQEDLVKVSLCRLEFVLRIKKWNNLILPHLAMWCKNWVKWGGNLTKKKLILGVNDYDLSHIHWRNSNIVYFLNVDKKSNTCSCDVKLETCWFNREIFHKKWHANCGWNMEWIFQFFTVRKGKNHLQLWRYLLKTGQVVFHEPVPVT